MFFKALKLQGEKLIIGFLTYPPGYDNLSEWNLKEMLSESHLFEKILYGNIFDLRWRNFRISEEFKNETQKAGFAKVKIHYDTFRVFPTAVATKS